MNMSLFMAGLTFNLAAVVNSLPSLDTTFARWSAAERENGGLDAANNWISVDGQKSLVRYGQRATYGATSFNSKAGINTSDGSWSLSNVALLNNSAATIIILNTADTLAVLWEFGVDTNNVLGAISNYIEGSNIVATTNGISGGLNMEAISVQQVSLPYSIGNRYYASPVDAQITVNGIRGTDTGHNNTSTGYSEFGTKTLYLGARNSVYYPLTGTIAAFHVFHTAPTDAEWEKWLSYYRLLYNTYDYYKPSSPLIRYSEPTGDFTPIAGDSYYPTVLYTRPTGSYHEITVPYLCTSVTFEGFFGNTPFNAYKNGVLMGNGIQAGTGTKGLYFKFTNIQKGDILRLVSTSTDNYSPLFVDRIAIQ